MKTAKALPWAWLPLLWCPTLVIPKPQQERSTVGDSQETCECGDVMWWHLFVFVAVVVVVVAAAASSPFSSRHDLSLHVIEVYIVDIL